MTDELMILPLGGLGEIGMNAMVISYRGHAIMIDCGVLFPDASMPGVDVVLPDFSLLERLGIELDAYIITHGHEDHIGALPYALNVKSAPIYASRFTCGLIQHKLNEWGLRYELNEVTPRDTLALGPFDLEFMRVTHSIPDGLAIAIKTPLGTIVHTGDFKIDHRPTGGEKTDLARFAHFGEQGVLALLSDSTNAENEGVSTSEAAIAEGLEHAMRDAPGRIFIAAFASHIHRLAKIVEISKKLGRKVVLNGRSMVNNIRIGRDLGTIQVDDDMFVPIEDAKDFPPSALTVLTTGSQAEPGSAIAKLATGDGNHLRINKGDLVIFSSRSIPGNERTITKAVDGLTRQGARVLYGTVSNVHTSGHAHKEEQRLMLNLVKPKYFVPIHGELHHLTAHARTAEAVGISPDNIFVIEDGQAVEINENGDARKGEHFEARKIMVDGKSVGDVGEVVLRDRTALASAGIALCFVSLDGVSGEIISGPDIISRGIIHEEKSQDILAEAREWVSKGIMEHSAEARRDRAAMEDAVRVSLKRFFRKQMERKPIVVAMVLIS